jgi:benzoyl-CoA reductase subunit D
MITAGIDAGAMTVKAVVVEDGRFIGRAILPAGTEDAASQVYEAALKDAGISHDDIEKVMATGAGRKRIPFAPEHVTEVAAAAKGAHALFPEARTVIDIGAEEGRAVRLDANGKVVDFAINEKCAAGAGAFIEAMARALETTVEEIGPLALKSTEAVSINAQCVVFAESEVVTLVHNRTPRENIARAVHDAIGDHVTSMVRRIGINKEIMLIGGVANNIGFVESLRQKLEIDTILIPEDAEFVGAFGAALAAAGQ